MHDSLCLNSCYLNFLVVFAQMIMSFFCYAVCVCVKGFLCMLLQPLRVHIWVSRFVCPQRGGLSALSGRFTDSQETSREISHQPTVQCAVQVNH